MIQQGYELSDVMIVPKHSNINNRNGDLSVTIDNLKLKIPIIASPMSGIVGTKLIKELDEVGGIGILHRFYSNESKRMKDCDFLRRTTKNFGIAVGLKDDFYKNALDYGASIIIPDIANGYINSLLNFTEEISAYIAKYNYKCLLMSGTVATYEGAKDLYNSGAKLVRVGIGSGNLCITRRSTAIGVPQFTAIQDCLPKENQNWYVVADGGIKTSGEAVVALAAGADLLMMGSLFGNCFESSHNGKIKGMASKEFQEQFYGEVKKSVEGIQKKAIKNIHLKDFINKFTWNMKSSFTYLNSETIADLQSNAEFILCGKNSIQ